MKGITIINSVEKSTISSEQAWRYRIVPTNVGLETCYFTDATEKSLFYLKEELEFLFDESPSFEYLDTESLNQLLHKYYPRAQKKNEAVYFHGTPDNFLPELISEAQNLKSSDIHIETYGEQARVRIRIDGQMLERYKLKIKEYPAIINKIKILAELDIAEKRLPQDGRIHYNENLTKVDIRVSILPTLHGEKVVLRLLSKNTVNVDIYKLGFDEKDLLNYLEGIKQPNGMVLISGPTGSGKTTTLYATLKLLNNPSRNILTIEDPVEYTLEGTNQVQLKENIGLSFSAALRTFLRQDPDIIMVGEIRDIETATMAVRASLTGHLVLSTIHTNSAWGTVSRLVDMGVPPFLLANTLNTTVAQRLVRVLCPLCKVKAEFREDLYPHQFKPPYQVNEHYLAQGCNSCFNTGYKGRKAIYEVISIDAVLSLAIKANAFDVADTLKQKGIKTIRDNAFELFVKGETSIEEIYPFLFNY